MAVSAGCRDFFQRQNLFDLSIDSDFTQGTKSLDWMNWIFSYCREHPGGTLFDAGIGLSKGRPPAAFPNSRDLAAFSLKVSL